MTAESDGATMIHRGHCFCGAVEIEVRGSPEVQGYCHCLSCRSHNGAPLRGFILWPRDAVTLTRGALASFNKMGFSDRRYCKLCGGHVLIDHPTIGMVDVHASAVPDFPFQPTAHLNYREHVLRIADGLPKFQDMPADAGGSGRTMQE